MVPKTYPHTIRLRARWSYEWGRILRAVLITLPIALLIGLVVNRANWTPFASLIGIAIIVVTGIYCWRGQTSERSVFPGLIAGMIPFGLLQVTRGYMCIGGSCESWCMTACICGGFVSGIVIAMLARHSPNRWLLWLQSSLLAILVGSLGCTCVVESSLLGLIGGFAISMLPARLISPNPAS